MYSNCVMQAPDGQVLCVCDAKKAQWYCDKELAGMSYKETLLQCHFPVSLLGFGQSLPYGVFEDRYSKMPAGHLKAIPVLNYQLKF